METIDALNEEYEDLHVHPRDARRNIVTCGVPLNHLVSHRFQVGEVTLRGIRLCQPCLHIAHITHHGMLSGLVHRGGLRAQILAEGTIRVGDLLVDLGEDQDVVLPADDTDSDLLEDAFSE